jgi:hypothetical protein
MWTKERRKAEMSERDPEEQARWEASLEASKMLRADQSDLEIGQFQEIKVDLEFAASVLRDQLSSDTVDSDTKVRLQASIRTLEALARKAV